MSIRPSLLAVTSQLPWPLDRGGHIRSYHLMRALAAAFDVRLLAGCRADEAGAFDAIRQTGIDLVPVVLPRRTGAGEAMRAVRALLAGEPYAMFHRHNRPEMWQALDRALTSGAPDVVYLDHLDSWLFARAFQRTPLVVHLHNVYSTLVRREADEGRSGLARRWLRRDAAMLDRVERQVMSAASAVLTVSDNDRAHFARLGKAPVEVVENGVDCAAYADLPTGRPGRAPLVLYLGALSWPPNADAAVFLARSALPALRRLVPGARLRIVGRDPGQAVLALAELDGVEVLANVPDVRPHLHDASVLAVPLDVGGGTRLKIVEAFAAGIPVVSTAVGAEGIAAVHDMHLLIAERAQFAGALAALLTDAARAARLAAEARRLAQDRYDWSSIGHTLQQIVGRVLAQSSRA
jgi:glycosyltransferase involved in cell wall biosynthesis